VTPGCSLHPSIICTQSSTSELRLWDNQMVNVTCSGAAIVRKDKKVGGQGIKSISIPIWTRSARPLILSHFTLSKLSFAHFIPYVLNILRGTREKHWQSMG
jgi:hypothetical protein